MWSTAMELDVDYFGIERSMDGHSFKEIGKMIGAGNSNSEHSYSYIDEKPTVGVTYFRLTEINRNGAKKTLATIKSRFTGERSVEISPNPLTKESPLAFSFNYEAQESHEVLVLDMRGVVVARGTINGRNPTLPLELGSGIYIVKISSLDFNAVQRIVVQ
jgi:hypothetical protein